MGVCGCTCMRACVHVCLRACVHVYVYACVPVRVCLSYFSSIKMYVLIFFVTFLYFLQPSFVVLN